MSELLEHRDAFFSLVADAHGSSKTPTPSDPVLPTGARWVPHTPKPGPLPERRRRPASEFCDMLGE